VEDTFKVVLTYVPAAGAVTVAVIVQLLLAAIVPPDNEIADPPERPVMIPPHCGVATFAESVTPVGKLSVNETPVNAVAVLGLVMVKVNVEVPPAAIGFGENDFEIEGGATTVTDAFAVLPVPPFVDVTLPVKLFCAPAVTPVTVTLKVQLPLAAIVPPLSDTSRVAAVVMSVPPHCAEVESATDNPTGKVSVNVTPVNAVPVFGFVMVNDNVVVPFKATVAAPNDLLIEGGATTVTEALAVLPVPPFAELTFPVKLSCAPAVIPVTVTLKVQVPLAAIVAPLNEITRVAAVVVSVPPHCAEDESTIDKPAGRVSENAAPVNAAPLLGFVIVKPSVVEVFNAIVAAPNDFAIEGGAMTNTVSEPVLFVSLLSVTFPFGSTVAVFNKLPAALGVTAKVILKDAFAGSVTDPPLALQVRLVPLIVQLIVPVGGVAPFVTLTAPCG
jgi:hypothetical protein